MSLQSGQSAPTDMAILNLDTSEDKGQVLTNKTFEYATDDSSVASKNYGLTEVDEFSERTPINDNPLLPHDAVEDRSEIKSIAYRSKGCYLFHFASEVDKILLLLATFCAMGAGASIVVHMNIFGEVTDVFTQASNTTDIFGLIGDDSIKYVILSFCVFILATLNMYIWSFVKEKQLIRVRQALIQSLFTKDISWFDQHQRGEISSKLLSDIEILERGMGETIAMTIQWISAVVALLINSFVQSPDVTGVIFPYFPCVIFAAVGSYWISKTYTQREENGKILVKKALIPAIDNIRLFAAFQSQEFEAKRLFKKFKFARHMTFRKYLCYGIKNGSFWMLAFFTLATGGWYASYHVLEGRMSPGEAIQAILGLLMSAIFVGQVYPCLECILKAKEAAKNLMDVLDEKPTINQNQKRGKDLPVHEIEIEFSDVHFSYSSASELKVLNGFQLTVKQNQTVALVGPTGCGKSTVPQLILRFYDAKKGQVLISGTYIKEMKLQNLRRHIGFVSQKSSLLSGSVADNIRLGHESVTREQIVNAAKLANAHEFIMKLPQGYNTLINEDGNQLTDNEKLRISIARALVRNPKILLLDEVTSALDNASEKIVLKAIEKAQVGRTTIITSHRLLNIQNSDLIVAMYNGRAVEQGSHQELMEMGGLYYNMWTMQSCMPKEKMSNYIFTLEVDHRRKKGSEKDWMAIVSHRKKAQNLRADKYEDLSLYDEREENSEEKVPRFSCSLMKRLLKLNFPDWSYAVIGSLASIAVGLIGPLMALFIAEFIRIFSLKNADDQYTARRDAAAQLMVVGAFLAPVNYLQNFCFAQTDSKLTMRMRDLLFKALLKQDMSYFDNPINNRDSLVNKFIHDAVDVNGATSLKLAMILQAVSSIISCIVICFVYSWQLAFPMLGIFLPTLIILNYIIGRLYFPEKIWKVNDLQEFLRKITQEAFANIKILAILVKEENFIRKCRDIVQFMYKRETTENIKFGILFGLNEGLIYCAFAVAFAIGSYLVQNKMADFPSIYRILGTVLIASLMTGRMLWNTPDFRRGRFAAKRLFPLIETVPDDSSTEEENKPLEECKGAVSFENVTFKDPVQPDVTVLDTFSMSVGAGESVAIVGAKEIEKKAIVELMERFYSPLSGTIKLDNVDIQNQKLRWFRSQIGVVKQEALFFDISIVDNILYGTITGVAEVVEACKALNIHEAIKSLPEGYNTKLEDAVLPFHPQRIVIARAIVRDAQIYFIDCESLVLTRPTEKDVKETMFQALAGKTTIFIAQRLSLVENVSRIFVVDEGKVAEVGTHDDLMAAEGIYCRLVKSQRNLKDR